MMLASYRLRFFGVPGENLILLYGQQDLSAPRYDLALLSVRLMGAAANELTLPAEAAEPPAAAGAPTSAKVFWGVLIVAVAAFLALIVRLMKKQPGAP